jgi:hypothetical protein
LALIGAVVVPEKPQSQSIFDLKDQIVGFDVAERLHIVIDHSPSNFSMIENDFDEKKVQKLIPWGTAGAYTVL